MVYAQYMDTPYWLVLADSCDLAADEKLLFWRLSLREISKNDQYGVYMFVFLRSSTAFLMSHKIYSRVKRRK